MTDQPLAPCPFCGKPVRHCDTSYGYWMVFCPDENECLAKPDATGDTEAEAIAAWNRRAPATPPADAELDALCERLEHMSQNTRDEYLHELSGRAAAAICRLRLAREVGVERVARALIATADGDWNAISDDDKDFARRLARAAISAMTGEKSNG